jgi:hypothetical protein
MCVYPLCVLQVPQLPDRSDLLTQNVATDAAGLSAFAKGEDGWVDMAQNSNVEAAVVAAAEVELQQQNGTPPVNDPEKAAGAEAAASAVHGTDDVNMSTAQGRACAARRFMIYVHRWGCCTRLLEPSSNSSCRRKAVTT